MQLFARMTEFLCPGSNVLIHPSQTSIPRDGEEGGALVELALCLPIMLTIVTGIFSFGIVFNNYIMLTDAVEIGARQLAISRGQVTDPCSTVSTTIASASPLLKSASLSYTFTLNGNSHTGTTCTSGAAQLVQGTAAQVQVTYPCTLSVYGKNLVPSCTLTAQTTELVQ